MNTEYNVSIIVPIYNAEKTIKNCLDRIIKESQKLTSEIILVDDCSTDKTIEIVKTFKEVKLIKLESNQGAGNARNKGADEAKYENLCFIDSDISISDESILNLVKRLQKDNDTGSVAATQDLYNLNREDWSSNFVCLKSCYGIEEIKEEINFSVCCTEFCVISKKLFFEIGKFKTFSQAGGEEFDIGYKISQLNKKNIKTKSANYSGYWCHLYIRFKRIVQRTSKYIPLFFEKKKFDSKGSFATFAQFFSSLITLLAVISFFISLFFGNSFFNFGLSILIIFQLISEFKFLIFAYKHYGLKMVFFSLFGIQVINFGILLGVFMFFYTLVMGNFSNNE
tara:strand:- start:133 stop:1146 length:1014 start_codon:yes stop_codon:yes gene_type:complete